MSSKVTVLMTVYNGTKYLKECIDSVLGQTFKDFEFLIVDDCSTDGSRDFIKSYGDDRIRLIENEKNMGQVRSLNIGLDCASGEYIARMDQDDIMIKDRLGRQSDFLDRRQDVAIVGTWGEVIDGNGKVFEKYHCPLEYEEIIGSALFGGQFLMHISAFFRKDAVVDVGKYDESLFFAEDYDLWTRLLLKGYRFANIPEILAKFRYHRESTSRRFPETQIKNLYTSISNFVRIICGSDVDSGLEGLCSILINAGMMNGEYWSEEKNMIDRREIITLLETLLRKTISYFDLKKAEAYHMKKIFCNRMLNFAYAAHGKAKKKSLPLYLFCAKNSLYLFKNPKLYLYAIKSVL